MKRFLFITILNALCAMLFSGCSTTREVTEIKSRVIQPAVIEDTLDALLYIEEVPGMGPDTVIVGVDIVPDRTGTGKSDTVTIVKYFPKSEKFYLKVKPDSIVLLDTIKTYETIEKIVETPLLAKAGLVLIGIVIASAVILFFKK